jgi:hypothetical protein
MLESRTRWNRREPTNTPLDAGEGRNVIRGKGEAEGSFWGAGSEDAEQTVETRESIDRGYAAAS